jgi:hypothetical protein
MYLGSMAPFLDWLHQVHPTTALILDCICELMQDGLLGYGVFMFLRRRFRVHQFSVYRRLLERIQDKKALCPTVSRKR